MDLYSNFSNNTPASAKPIETEVPLIPQILTIVSCALSIIGSFIIIITYIAWKDIRTLSRRLLVFLAIADLISAVGFGYGAIRNFSSDDIDCKIQSGVTVFGSLSSFLWTVSVAVYLYITIVKNDLILASKLHLHFHLISWGIPFVIVVFGEAFGGFGYDSSDVSVGWCWVKIEDNELQLFWMIMSGKLWEISAYIILPVLYILIKVHIYKKKWQPPERASRNLLNERLSAMLKIDKKLTLIPIIFICLRFWSTLRFFLFIVDSELVTNHVLLTLHGIGNTFQGAANCILFCIMTKKVRDKLLLGCCTCFEAEEYDMLGCKSACALCCQRCWRPKVELIRSLTSINEPYQYSKYTEASALLHSSGRD